MKNTIRGKIATVAVCAAVAASCAVGAVTLSGCAKTTGVNGEMHYVQWNTNYGIKVNVQVQSDKKGDRIRKVTVAESDYVEVSPEGNGWDPKAWNDGLQTLLNSYRGLYVADVLSLEAHTEDGIPAVKADDGFVNFGDNLIITGATLGSGRLLLAVQNALSSLENYEVAEGEYGYTAWGTDFGAKVRVVLKDGVIQKVVTLSSGYSNASAQGWTPQTWYSKADEILAAYKGKTAEYILGLTATVEGQNGATENAVSDSNLLATDATLSSARLLLAVQNALKGA
ncbi:MAG: hypothetical protein NC131_00060 [Roseburia sp.]|nr:hypothetical protein [Roseburia sp.]